jgi:anthranilate synthase component 1
VTAVARRAPFQTGLSPHALFQRLRGPGRNAILLESRPGPRRLARYSILAADPADFLADRHGEDPFPHVRETLGQHGPVADDAGGFSGGLVGAIGYDAVTHLDLPGHPARAPTFLLGLYLDAVVYDHGAGTTHYMTAGEDRRQLYADATETDPPAHGPLRVDRVRSNTTEAEFEDMVNATQRRIRDGETYQTVLSRRFDASYTGDLGQLYERLRRDNPSPYMYFLDFDARAIVGSSPEMLVRVEDQQVETFPIAGTRPVLPHPDANAAVCAELRQDPKENAEHIMLVDLARNDLARVCRFGTVDVPTLRRLESYANVHHLVSRVTGRLRDDKDAIDAFSAVFPAGTVSGAPKIRAMEIIDELEKDPRGLYAGSVGYFGLNGNLDSAITIRTMTSDGDGGLSVQAGAGIVQDSTAAGEWAETRHKAEAILRYLEAAA